MTRPDLVLSREIQMSAFDILDHYNLIVKISTNVMTHHVPPTQVVQTLSDHFTVHVTMVTLVMDLIAVI